MVGTWDSSIVQAGFRAQSLSLRVIWKWKCSVPQSSVMSSVDKIAETEMEKAQKWQDERKRRDRNLFLRDLSAIPLAKLQITQMVP